MKNSKTIDVVGIIFLFVVLGLSLAFCCNKDNSHCMDPDTRMQAIINQQRQSFSPSFNAIRAVEYYFARKLLVVPTIAIYYKSIVSGNKAKNLLDDPRKRESSMRILPLFTLN